MLCVTHVPWLTSVSLTAGFLWRKCGKKVPGPCTWATRQLYVSGKRPMTNYVNTISFTRGFHTTKYDQINLHSVCIWDAFLNQYRLSLHTRVMDQLLIFAISTFMMRFDYLLSLNLTIWCSYYTWCIIWHKFHLLQFFNFEIALEQTVILPGLHILFDTWQWSMDIISHAFNNNAIINLTFSRWLLWRHVTPRFYSTEMNDFSTQRNPWPLLLRKLTREQIHAHQFSMAV